MTSLPVFKLHVVVPPQNPVVPPRQEKLEDDRQAIRAAKDKGIILPTWRDHSTVAEAAKWSLDHGSGAPTQEVGGEDDYDAHPAMVLPPPVKVSWKLSLGSSLESWWKKSDVSISSGNGKDPGADGGVSRWGVIRGAVNLASAEATTTKVSPFDDSDDRAAALHRWKVAGMVAGLLDRWQASASSASNWTPERSVFAARTRECDSGALTDTSRVQDLNFAHDWGNLEAKVSWPRTFTNRVCGHRCNVRVLSMFYPALYRLPLLQHTTPPPSVIA